MSKETKFGVLHFIGEKYVCRMNYNPVHFEENILPVLGKLKIVDYNSYTIRTKKMVTRLECIVTREQFLQLKKATIKKNIEVLQKQLEFLNY